MPTIAHIIAALVPVRTLHRSDFAIMAFALRYFMIFPSFSVGKLHRIGVREKQNNIFVTEKIGNVQRAHRSKSNAPYNLYYFICDNSIHEIVLSLPMGIQVHTGVLQNCKDFLIRSAIGTNTNGKDDASV